MQLRYPYQNGEGKWGFTDIFGRVVEKAHLNSLDDQQNPYREIMGCREKDLIKPLPLREILNTYYDFNVDDSRINNLEEFLEEFKNYECRINRWQEECEKVCNLKDDIDIYRYDYGKDDINNVGIVRYGLMKNGNNISMFDWDNIYAEQEGLVRISSSRSLSLSLETFSIRLPEINFRTLLDLTHREDIKDDLEVREYGFINLKGEIIIPLKYDFASDFHEGFATVRCGDEWGHIDKNDNVIIPIIFDWVGDFQDGFARVLYAGLYYVIDKEGYCYESFEDLVNGKGSKFYL